MKKISWLLIMVSVLALLPLRSASGVNAQDGNGTEANKAVLLAFFEAEAAREYDRMGEFFVDDFVRHSAATTAVMPEVQVTSRDQYMQFLQATAAMFPDYYNTPQTLISEGDHVAFYTIWSGTYAENGNRIEVPIIGYVRFESGKMAEMWIEWDNLTWNMQMGTPAQANEALARRWFDEVWIKRNPAVIDEVFAPNAVWCVMANHCASLTNDFRKEWVSEVLAAFPDLNVTLIPVVASGDTVFMEWRGTGTFSSAFAEMLTGESLTPTNKMEEWSVLWVGTFDDGKVIREQWYWTWYGWPVAPFN